QDIETTDGPSTERLVARHFPERQARGRLEPLPPLVDEREECNRRLEQGTRQFGNVIELRLRPGVPDLVTPQGREATAFGRFVHASFGTCHIARMAASKQKSLVRV